MVFILGFFFNLIWENLHSFLYVHYMGGPITTLLLMRSALVDALIITLMALPFLFWKFLKKRIWLIFLFGVAVAVCIEWFALLTKRWEYGYFMPIVPILNVGLSPAIQLGVLGFICLWLANLTVRSHNI